MSTPVRIESLGDGVDSAVLAAWLAAEGDRVTAGEAVAEVMTDKVNIEIESPATGILVRIACGLEDTVTVGQVIAEVES